MECVWHVSGSEGGVDWLQWNDFYNCRNIYISIYIFFYELFFRVQFRSQCHNVVYKKKLMPLMTWCGNFLVTRVLLCFVTEQCPPRWARVEWTNSAACSSTGGLYRTTSDTRSWRWHTTAFGLASSHGSCAFLTAASPKSSAATRRRVRSGPEP